MREDNLNPVIVDLGCGPNKAPGAIGVDNVALEGVDIVHDLLDFPYPFEAGSVHHVRMSHILEHFVIEDISKIMEEVYRILRPDGDVLISVPHALCADAHGGMLHKSFFGFRAFLFFAAGYSRAYYKSLVPQWRILGVWSSIGLVCDVLRPAPAWSWKVGTFFARCLNWTMRKDKTLTLPEIIVKIAPFWLVSIHCRLAKASSPDFPGVEPGSTKSQWPFGKKG